jgi:hypothetical protein
VRRPPWIESGDNVAQHLKPVDPVGTVRLCVELCRRTDGRETHWSVVASLPGREGAAIYRWTGERGYLTESQLRDMVGRLSKVVTNCVLLTDGLQQELPM